MDMSDRSPVELMNMYAGILAELNRRGVVRTYNSPVGDYAEWLVAEKLNLRLEPNAKKGYDAYDKASGARFQIKSRWERGAPSPQSRELNVIRNFDDGQFDYLIAIIFDKYFSVKEAYMIPHGAIRRYARYNRHQNGHILFAMGPLLCDAEVENITDCFR